MAMWGASIGMLIGAGGRLDLRFRYEWGIARTHLRLNRRTVGLLFLVGLIGSAGALWQWRAAVVALDGERAELTEVTLLFKLFAKRQHELFNVGRNAIGNFSRRTRKVAERSSIQTFAFGSSEPTFDGRHRNVKGASHGAQGLTATNGGDHIASLLFDRAFLFMINSPRSQFSIDYCHGGAGTQVSCRC